MILKRLNLALGLPFLFAACVDAQNLGDPQETESGTADSGETDTAASTGSQDPDETGEMASDEGGELLECPERTEVVVSVVVQSDVLTAAYEASPEAGNPMFDASCTLDSLTDEEGTASVGLTCVGAPDQADTTWSLRLGGVPVDDLSIAEGDDVQMFVSVSWGFEAGGATMVRLEQDGAPLLFAYAEAIEGGFVGVCGPGEEDGEGRAEAFFAPLGLVIERGTCAPIERLRLDFELEGEAASILDGQQGTIGASGWTVAAQDALCISQEDDLGVDAWRFRVAAWKAGA